MKQEAKILLIESRDWGELDHVLVYFWENPESRSLLIWENEEASIIWTSDWYKRSWIHITNGVDSFISNHIFSRYEYRVMVYKDIYGIYCIR